MDHPITRAATSPTGWLTAVLRPAGTLDGAGAGELLRLLADLSATADMVVVDLAAARVRDVQAFAGALRLPAARLARRGRCLLLVNMPPALERIVRTGGMPAAVLPAGGVPAPA
jgi:anti-anti-sigma regulatory factor